MSGRLRAATFVALVVATFAAFFVVQRIKREPSDVRVVAFSGLLSPNRDGRDDRALLGLRLRRADTVSVRVIDDRGDVVRTLVADRPLAKGKLLVLRWDGRDDAGRRVPDGSYEYRVNLQDQGRAILIPEGLRVDTTPPRPRVLKVGDDNRRADILPLPDGGALTVHIYNPVKTRPTEALIYRTSPNPELVDERTIAAGQGTFTWDGTKDGALLPAGTYAIALRTTDLAGNVGSNPRKLPPDPPYGQELPGHGGVTIRNLGIQPSLEPTIAGSAATFGVDARGRNFNWSVRRVGVGRPEQLGRPRTDPVVQIDAPDAKVSGLYLFEAHTRAYQTMVPFPVQAVKTQKVLVVLPAITWQGVNPVDDDSDGWPNTLTDGLPVRRERVLADGLPEDLVKRIAPLLIFLDRSGLRYDLTTDLALSAGVGPRLEGHTGVLLTGDERWLPADQQQALRRFVRAGGNVATFGVQSLRRQVTLTPQLITNPTAAAQTDAFGATLRGPVDRPGTTLTIFNDDINLFAGDVYGGTGVFSGYDEYEETVNAGPGAQVVASAVTDDGKKVIVAEKLGDGLIVRFGLPQLPERLGTPGNETELVKRTWTLLSQ